MADIEENSGARTIILTPRENGEETEKIANGLTQAPTSDAHRSPSSLLSGMLKAAKFIGDTASQPYDGGVQSPPDTATPLPPKPYSANTREAETGQPTQEGSQAFGRPTETAGNSIPSEYQKCLISYGASDRQLYSTYSTDSVTTLDRDAVKNAATACDSVMTQAEQQQRADERAHGAVKEIHGIVEEAISQAMGKLLPTFISPATHVDSSERPTSAKSTPRDGMAPTTALGKG